MEIRDTDSWQFRQNLKLEEVSLRKLMEQLDTELVSPTTFSESGILSAGAKPTA
jgi:hypothetical protein